MANQQMQQENQPRRAEANHKQAPEQQPPQPPDLPKKLEFTRSQIIGIPLLLLIPLLALFGVFGSSSTEAESTGHDLRVAVIYPSRFRYQQGNTLEIYVQNLSAGAMPTVTVSIDAAYLLAFSEVNLTPSVDEVTADAYRFYLQNMAPQETRLISVAVKADQYWQQRGQVAVQAMAGEPLHVELSTFVFP